MGVPRPHQIMQTVRSFYLDCILYSLFYNNSMSFKLKLCSSTLAEIRHSNIEFNVISSLLQRMRKGLKDSATVKAEPQESAPSISIPVLSLDELIEKTDDFGATALIGEGSYGRVYYAVLDTGTKMAVKKLDSTENETTSEFLTQVSFAIKDWNYSIGYTVDIRMKSS